MAKTEIRETDTAFEATYPVIPKSATDKQVQAEFPAYFKDWLGIVLQPGFAQIQIRECASAKAALFNADKETLTRLAAWLTEAAKDL